MTDPHDETDEQNDAEMNLANDGADDVDSGEDEGVEIPVNADDEHSNDEHAETDEQADAAQREDEAGAGRTRETGDDASEEASSADAEATGDPGDAGEASVADGELDDLYLDPEDDAVEIVEDDEIDGDDMDTVGEAEDAPDSGDHEEFVERIDELEDEVDRLREERDQMKDKMMRAAADLENFRKRAEREKEELRKYGAKDVILELLPAIDNLERALQHGKEDADEEDDAPDRGESIVDGVDMTLRQLHTALEKHGIEVFDAEGERFDPELHEAMQQVETDEHPPGTVVEQFQRGYTIKDRLLRPALVAVAKAPASAETDDASEHETSEEAGESTGAAESGDAESSDEPAEAARVDEDEASNEDAETADGARDADGLGEETSSAAAGEAENATGE